MQASVLPDDAVSRSPEFVATTLFVWRVLRPLLWFGLLECREAPDDEARSMWRKSALFDRFLRFDRALVKPVGALH